jgi:uncharacterized protein YbbC (DUF1343 family)
MKLGLDVFLEKHVPSYRGQRIGLVSNITGVNSNLVPTIDLFHEHSDIRLTALYGPEHGIRGDAKEGEEVGNAIDPYTGLPVYSLFGDTKKPSQEMLDQVDVVFMDLQDIGSRYYTYIYTMAYVMEACGEQGKKFVVLDRPNPISGTVMEGNLIEPSITSFVGRFPIPNRHGLTIGEMALLYKYEFGIDCDVTVIPMEGWKRGMYYDETGLFWVQSTPNSTCLDMGILYPGTCLVEGTNLSEGRGTTRPFEYIGAPYVDGYQLAKAFNGRLVKGVTARPVSFMPTYQKHVGVRCEGVQLHVTDRDILHSLEAGLVLLETFSSLYPNEFVIVDGHKRDDPAFFDLLAGTTALKSKVLEGKTSEFLEACQPQLEKFRTQVTPYLLYK